MFWITDRLSTENKLDLSKTFEDQKDLVNRIIVPTVARSIDSNTFPVVDGILYNMIHERHRHQRKSQKLKEQEQQIQDKKARRKHKNSRRSEVRNQAELTYILL